MWGVSQSNPKAISSHNHIHSFHSSPGKVSGKQYNHIRIFQFAYCSWFDQLFSSSNRVIHFDFTNHKQPIQVFQMGNIKNIYYYHQLKNNFLKQIIRIKRYQEVCFHKSQSCMLNIIATLLTHNKIFKSVTNANESC